MPSTRKPVSQARADAARRNGARSRGPKTAAGKARSSQNATEHGIYAHPPILDHESRAVFDDVLRSYLDHFNPQNIAEMAFVEQMVTAHWRMRRLWAVSDATVDLEMNRMIRDFRFDDGDLNPPARIGLALDSLCTQSSTFKYLTTLEFRYSRQFSKAMQDLQRLRRTPEPEKEETNPRTPQPSKNKPVVKPIWHITTVPSAEISTDPDLSHDSSPRRTPGRTPPNRREPTPDRPPAS